jgi:tryptophanyl-tRNA synthetase
MRELNITTREEGQRLDKILSKYLNKAPKSFVYKMLRKKNIKLNGKKATGNEKLSQGDQVCIYLAEDPKDIKKKVMSMFTDPNHIRIEDPGSLEGNTVFTYLDAFCNDQHFEEYLPDYKNLDELKEHYQRGGLGDVKVKKFLNNVLQEELEPIRKRREELQKDIPYVYEVLKKGSEVARETAAQTLHEVRDAMKINYFDDMELIRSQAKKYE